MATGIHIPIPGLPSWLNPSPDVVDKGLKKTPVVGPVASAVDSTETGINAVGDFFKILVEPDLWVRVGEVLAGIILLTVGLHSMLNGNTAYDTTRQGAALGVAKLVK